MWFAWLEIGGILNEGSDGVSKRPAKNAASKTPVRGRMLFMKPLLLVRLQRS
jgi:hypothetical protein